jgi:3-keto-L-gulonate-6-phosphate decarboxylase
MARLFTPSELATLRRQFLDSLDGEQLEVLSELAKQAADDAQAAADEAMSKALDSHAEATSALFVAQAAATPATVEQAETDAKAYADGLVSGLATEAYADQAETDAKAYADGLVVGLATEDYVDGKFPEVSGTFKVVDLLDTKEVTLTIAGGLVTAFERAP